MMGFGRLGFGRLCPNSWSIWWIRATICLRSLKSRMCCRTRLTSAALFSITGVSRRCNAPFWLTKWCNTRVAPLNFNRLSLLVAKKRRACPTVFSMISLWFFSPVTSRRSASCKAWPAAAKVRTASASPPSAGLISSLCGSQPIKPVVCGAIKLGRRAADNPSNCSKGVFWGAHSEAISKTSKTNLSVSFSNQREP